VRGDGASTRGKTKAEFGDVRAGRLPTANRRRPPSAHLPSNAKRVLAGPTMTRAFELAQVNFGRLLAPLDSPMVRDFVDNLDRINAVADASPGFIWRLMGEGGDATDLSPPDDPLLIVNMSVWTDIPHLGAFVYRSAHAAILRRREEWFQPIEIFQALWWLPAGHRPTLEEARAKLALLAAHGPTAEAFTFRQPFRPPGEDCPSPMNDRADPVAV
jgi:hypothetical protein